MLYAGLDYHKRYSLIDVKDENGIKKKAMRVENEFQAVQEFFADLDEPCKVVLEAGYNWGKLYDWLDQIEKLDEVQLAHPYRVKAIAAAQVKTDSVDAGTLADLLRANLIPRAHIPSR
ncbi:MAG: transposase, partial [Acidobacteriota bacterium]